MAVQPSRGYFPNFGSGGIVLGPLGSIHALAIQRDGKILAAEYLYEVGLTVARYLPDGQVDDSFGSAGVGSVGGSAAGGTNGIAVQSDGKIVLVGVDATTRGIAVGRLNRHGMPDPGFGSGGLVLTPTNFSAASVMVQPDGKIVVGGTAESPRYEGSLARYLPDGSLDPTFGDGGIAQFRRPALAIGRLAAGPGDTILAAVTEEYRRYPGHRGTTLGVARFTDRGHLDSSFGQGGVALGPFARNTAGGALAVGTDGKIVVAGTYVIVCCLQQGRFALARFNADGSPDTSFSADGVTTTKFGTCKAPEGYAVASGVAVEPSGKIVAAGYTTHMRCGPYSEVVLARYQPGGALDGTFGDGGKVRTATGDGAYGWDMAVLPTHRILVGGLGSNTQGSGVVLLAQYLAS